MEPIDSTATPLEAGLEAINSQKPLDDRSEVFAAQCRALLHGYDLKYADKPLSPIFVERMLTAPVIEVVLSLQRHGNPPELQDAAHCNEPPDCQPLLNPLHRKQKRPDHPHGWVKPSVL